MLSWLHVAIMSWLHVASCPYLCPGPRAVQRQAVQKEPGRHVHHRRKPCHWNFEECEGVGGIFFLRCPYKTKRADVCRKMLLLPHELASYLEDNEIEVMDDSQTSVRLEGLVQVRPGMLYDGPVTNLDWKMQAVRAFLLWPSDFCVVDVDRAWRTKGSHTDILNRSRRSGPRNPLTKILWEPNFLHDCIFPDGYERSHTHMVHGDVVQGCPSDMQSLLGSFDGPRCSEIPVLVLPRCLCDALFNGKLLSLGLLGRWNVKLFPDWPPQEWLSARWNMHERLTPFWEHASKDLHPDTLDECIGKVRSIASHAELDTATRQSVVDIAMYLDNISQGLKAFKDPRRLDLRTTSSTAHWAPQIMFAAVMSTQHLRQHKREPLLSVLRHALPLSVPRPLVNFVDHIQLAAPADESIRNGRFILELTLLLHRRHHDQLRGASIYLWWDATSKKRDYLLTKAHYILDAELMNVFDAVNSLRKGEVRGDAHHPDDVISAGIRMLHFLPVLLGLRCTSLVQKIGALMHQLCLICACMDDIAAFFDQVVSVTTDMGTELGLAEFHSHDFRRLIPPWFEPLDPQDDTGGLLPHQNVRQVSWSDAWLLAFAIPVPGMMHIISNLLIEVHEGLNLWSAMTAKLHEISKLLTITQRRERFIEKCLRGTPHECHVHLFDHEFDRLYDKRWFAVLQFLKSLKPVLAFLSASWNAGLYLAGHSGADGADDVADDSFQASHITKALQDKMLVAFVSMVFTLDWFVARIASWAEGCDCHEQDLVEEPTKYKRNKRMRRHLKLQQRARPCMNKGKRSASMASGQLDVFLAALQQKALGQLMSEIRWGLTEAEWQQILADWTRAVGHVLTELSQKCAFWRKLPWFLCAMAVSDEMRGREFARTMMQMYDSTADVAGAGNASHHRLSQRFLRRGGALRALIEKWVDGAALSTLPELAIAIAKLSKIPIVEREIEAEASLVNHGLRNPGSGVIEASLLMKMGPLQERLDNDPAYFLQLMELWPKVSSPSLVPQLFGFHSHPQVQALLNSSERVKGSKWWSLLAKLIYHADLPAQFLRFDSAQADHAAFAEAERKALKLQEQSLQIVRPKQQLTEGAVLKRAFCRQVQARVEVEQFYILK